MSGIELKICGVQTADEAKILLDSGIKLVGLNFIPNARHFIPFETATSMMQIYKNETVKTVALFRDQPLQLVNAYATQLGCDYVQLGGAEPADYAAAVNMPVIRAISVDPLLSHEAIAATVATYPADYFILDRHVQGTGKCVDLDLATAIIKEFPGKIFLAGGLTPDNLPDILARMQPYGIDIASGVRTNGTLDRQKVMACLQLVAVT